MLDPSTFNSPSKRFPGVSRVPIFDAIQDCRRQTLAFVAAADLDLFRLQAHPDFSPIGWHLGHIAYTESLWILEHLAGEGAAFSTCGQRFAADGLPKAQRQNLPALEQLLAYLAVVRDRTLAYLARQGEPTGEALRLWHWLIQHESQHVETMAMVLAMHRLQRQVVPFDLRVWEEAQVWKEGQLRREGTDSVAELSEMIFIEAGEFSQGFGGAAAIDNERPVHRIWLDDYWIDPAPVTCGEYQKFMAAGGYKTAKWWCKKGWAWQQQAQVNRPLYWPLNWLEASGCEAFPVCGVSWYEAAAYARFVGKRLPSEAEWEKAVGVSLRQGVGQGRRQVGQVWEWTHSWFSAYPGFKAFPYADYSQLYFDGGHRVLRGGSWATFAWARRPSFRNWYHPWRREVFAGFRCAC